MTGGDEMTRVDDGSGDDLANIIMIFVYLIKKYSGCRYKN